MFNIKKFSTIQLGLASPEEIESWASKDINGVPLEVTKAETLNYRSQKPEKDGLFCEKIFGPTQDYTCSCGRLKRAVEAGTICPQCGVECTTKSVRRERMSFIKLACPVTHIWYLKGTPARIPLVLDLGPKEVEEVVYFISYVVLNNGGCPAFSYKEVLDEIQIRERFIVAIEYALDNGLAKEGSSEHFFLNDDLDLLKTPSAGVDVKSIAMNLARIFPGFELGNGAEAIQKLLCEVDIDKEYEAVYKELHETKPNAQQKRQKLAKRLEVLQAFKQSDNKPEWMILTNLPVIPPDLRPMIPLDGSRFASADLNELYQRVIQRNEALKKLRATGGTTPMIINAKRILQDSVDALIENGRRTKAVLSQNGRPYKSLSAALKGKQGRFRQNLLGKRVDYSGRSVIAVGPDLRMDECGLPREMAVRLFKPFIERKLVEMGVCDSPKAAETEHIMKNTAQMWSALEEVVKEHPVLLNRAPTLHRLGIQAYHPRLVEGRAIRLFPLSCTAFNADFDGDQMAVHVPLSKEAIWEAENLMLSSKNILGPKDGKPIVTPTKDMVLGNYYLTLEEDSNDFLNKAKECKATGDLIGQEKFELYARSEGKVFKDENEVLVAYETKQIHLHSRIAIKGSGLHNSTFTVEQNNSYLITTPGKIIFNQIFDKEFPFVNFADKKSIQKDINEYFLPKGSNIKEEIKARKPIKFGEKFLSMLIDEYLKVRTVDQTSEMLNKMKDQGFKFATKSAVTVSLFDIVDVDREDMFKKAEETIEKWEEAYDDGKVSDKTKSAAIIKIWEDVGKEMAELVMAKIKSNKRNPLCMLVESGAVGKKESFNQLAGMKGIMSKPNGEKSELPIKSNFKEGLTVTEFFNSTHGTRKGGSDTALKTAQSGYLTRKLVDVAHDVIIKEEDCHCNEGIVVKAMIDLSTGKEIQDLKSRIIGRYTLGDVIDNDGVVICKNDTLITPEIAKAIDKAGVKQVKIRSIFTCKCKDGICQKCYGTDLASGKLVKIGEAVGVIAAQSIGEPGTQLTMRNFNTGGVSSGGDITQGLPRITELFEARHPKAEALISEINGEIVKIEQEKGIYHITVKNSQEERTYDSFFGAKLAKELNEFGELVVKSSKEVGSGTEYEYYELKARGEDGTPGSMVVAGQRLTEGAIYPQKLLEVTNDPYVAENYILTEVFNVYHTSAGTDINNKHLETIIRQMFRKRIVKDAKDTDLIPNSKVTLQELNAANAKVIPLGKEGAVVAPVVTRITSASLECDSWLSAASFQETTKVLADATTRGKIDHLHGLKENVIVGKLIPAGTGLKEERFATSEEELETGRNSSK